MGIFRAFADAHLRLRRISQQEVRQGIPAVGAAVGVNSARVVRKARVEVEMEKVAAELNAVAAAMDQDVVVKLEIAIDPEVKPAASPMVVKVLLSETCG